MGVNSWSTCILWRKILEFCNICLIIIIIVTIIIYNYWLRLDIIFWITVLHSWRCWFQDVLKMTSCQSCLSNRLTQNMQPETWNSSIHLCSFVDSLGPRRLCGGPNGWSLKRVAWKQGKVWSSWWIKTGYVGWWIEGFYGYFFSINWCLQNRSCFELACSPAFATV